MATRRTTAPTATDESRPAGRRALTAALALLAAVATTVALVATGPPAGATPSTTTLYVTTSGSGTACTQVAPCGQVKTALTTAAGIAGAVVVEVGPGTYTNNLFTGGGSSDTSVTVDGSTAGTTVLNGNGDTGSTFEGGSAGSPSVTLDRLEITDSGGENGQSAITNDGATLTVTDSLVTGNSIVDGSEGSNTAHGGGFFLDGGSTTLINDTITDNSATASASGSENFASASGGGIFADGPLTMTNVTLAGNTVSATATDGAISHASGGGLALADETTTSNSVVAGNSPDNCDGSVATDGGGNVDSADTCGFSPGKGDLVNTDPGLGALADNGGPTQTEAVGAGSPAVGLPTAACPATDQRGYTRSGAPTSCTSGAYEYDGTQPTQTVTFTSTAPAAEVGGPTYTPAATGGASGNPVTFAVDASSTAGACTLTAGVVTFTGAGSCIIDADQAGDATYAAGQAHQTVTVVAPVTYHPLTPTRICDTRSGQPKSACPAGTSLGPGGSLTVTAEGNGGVPDSGVTAVVANITAVDTTARSHLTVYPAGETEPTVSSLNWAAGQTIPNLVTVGLDASGRFTASNYAGSTDVIVDVQGYYGPGDAGTGLYDALATPARICDTRPDNPSGLSGLALTQCEGQAPAPGHSLAVTVDGLGGVPASGVGAVVLNVTAVGPDGPGYLTAYPAGGTAPMASNVNFTAGAIVPNRVIVPVGIDGVVDIFSASGSPDILVDVAGWFTDASDASAPGSQFTAAPTPVRVCDTRNDGQGTPCQGKTLVAGGETLAVTVAGVDGVPAGATAVVLNVTVTDTTATSHLTVYPAGQSRPTISDLNWTAGRTVPNMVVATVGTDGQITVANYAGSTDVLVDVVGWFQ